MKSIAMAKASDRWPDATVSWESEVSTRRADVLVTFLDSHERHGDGIAIECQHKNESKNIEAVNRDFLEKRHSVLWLYDEHFEKNDVDLEAGNWNIWWAHQIPEHNKWKGYHGVIHWLRQSKPTSIPKNIPLPKPDGLHYSSTLHELIDIWWRYYKSSLDNRFKIKIPCSGCTRETELDAEVYHKVLNTNSSRVNASGTIQYRSTVELIREKSHCIHCNSTTQYPAKRIELKVGSPPAQAKKKIRKRTSHAPIKLPCPACQEFINFHTEFKSTADNNDPAAILNLKTAGYCESCDSYIRISNIPNGTARFINVSKINSEDASNRRLQD
jgi:hypothetical protein